MSLNFPRNNLWDTDNIPVAISALFSNLCSCCSHIMNNRPVGLTVFQCAIWGNIVTNGAFIWV